MFILVAPKLFIRNFNGMAVFPFIILKYKEQKKDLVMINHEKIHLRQQIELLWIFFFIWYGIEFLIRLIQYKDFMKAYSNISFEREAYKNENHFSYLKKRRIWSFLCYL